MYYETQNQPQLLAYLLCGGVVLGVLYDLLRALRLLGGGRGAVTALCDGAFCLLGAALLWHLGLQALHGALRWYGFAVPLVGMAGYFAGLSHPLRALLGALGRGMRALWRSRWLAFLRK